jgi:hypothetical protein
LTTFVWIESRSFGGVSMIDMSRMPTSDMFNVLGMGVAVIVSTSTRLRICLMRSLCATPNRCSSSTTSRPRSLKVTSFDSSRCVPTTTSTFPDATPARASLISCFVRNRLTISMVSGNPATRSRRVFRCWKASTVVGASTATCLPSMTALKAARIATSVLP